MSYYPCFVADDKCVSQSADIDCSRAVQVDRNGVVACTNGRRIVPIDPNPPPRPGRGSDCTNDYQCGAIVGSRPELRDIDPYNAQVPDDFRPLCRVYSGPDMGNVVNCIDQDNSTPGGELACADMDTNDNNNGECVYCPPGTDCASSMPSGGDGPMELSAFRMRTRMSMARFR